MPRPGLEAGRGNTCLSGFLRVCHNEIAWLRRCDRWSIWVCRCLAHVDCTKCTMLARRVVTVAALGLRPFWRYYGGKWRAAPRYPAPAHDTIIEPFAGAAGYACRYPDRRVILVDKYPTICEMWRWLIRAKPLEVLMIPEVDSVDDLPSWVPQGARYLVGFSMNAAASTPRRTLSSGRRQLRAMNRQFEGWTKALRTRVAWQVQRIRHWKVIEGDYTKAPSVTATWFVDPPYNNNAGRHYVHGTRGLNYASLADWCKERSGQVIVCENEGATWLPFATFATFKAGLNGDGSREVVWIR